MAGQPKLRYETATIDISADDNISSVIQVGAGEIVGVIAPSNFTTSNIQFQACDTVGGTYLDVYDADNALVAITSATASRFYTISFIGIKGLGFIKLNAVTNQITADKEVIVVIKDNS